MMRSYSPSRFKRSFAILPVFILLFNPDLSSPQRLLGPFEAQTDIGGAKPGSAKYDELTGEFTIEGSGGNMWADRDEFHYVWKRLTGNFILTARLQFAGKGVENHRKIGWIVRSSLDPRSIHVNASVHGDGLTSLQFRRTEGGPTEEIKSEVNAPDVIQLERKDDKYIMSAAHYGETFAGQNVVDIALGDDVYAGLYVCSHNQDVIEKAIFKDVRITVPARDNFVPYRDYIGSDLEVMDIDTGLRRIIYHSPESIQAPNWTRDGKALIYNSKGRLFRFDLRTSGSTMIDSGFAAAQNNDHAISFDGKMLAISHHSADDANASIIYTIPINGGIPRRITSQGPSYLHGWSPDGKYLVFTGVRDGKLDIYKVRSSGGEEVRLTTHDAVDDGPEYSPDGKYIYFNSSRSGSMQIWRMNSDGTSQEHVTNDGFNNWFPHISPNGKWIVFISFDKDVAPDDHPFYKQVYIRLMPRGGGPARVLAYVYGGQGTMNVPSWSSDSKRIAFVSNTAGK